MARLAISPLQQRPSIVFDKSLSLKKVLPYVLKG